jgi:hypothetical protein
MCHVVGRDRSDGGLYHLVVDAAVVPMGTCVASLVRVARAAAVPA